MKSMKKILFAITLLALGFAFGDITSKNVIGWSRKASGLTESKSARQALAVNWSAKDGDISLGALVSKLNFNTNDTVSVCDATGNRESWKLNEDGEWVATTASGDIAERTVPRGSVVWIERADASDPVYTCGFWGDRDDFDGEDDSIEVKSGTNLVAAANCRKVNLNDEFPEPGAKDCVILPIPGKEQPRIYTYESGKWGYMDTDVRKSEDADVTIPAGCGFWYGAVPVEITIEAGDGIDCVTTNGVMVVDGPGSGPQPFALPAGKGSIELGLKAETGTQTFKVVRNNVTNVTEATATYKVAPGDALKFIAE